MTSPTGIISEFVQGKDRIRAEEVAAYLLDRVLEELDVPRNHYDDTDVAKVVVWRGAMATARDALKRPTVVEELLNGDAAQGELLSADYSEFVRTGSEFVRRHALNLEEYQQALVILRERRDAVANKVARYEADLERALPFWTPGMTFGQAIYAAAAAR